MTEPNNQNRSGDNVPTDKDGSSGEHLSDSFQEEIEKTLNRTMPVEHFTPEGILKQASQASPPPKGPAPVEVVKIPPPEVTESSIASKLPDSFPEETDENRYAIDTPLGVGASGTVFRAWDNTMQREVAIKFMNTADAKNTLRLQRFVGEGRIAAKLDHPGVAPVFDMEVSESGQPYLSMRRIKGETLEAAIQKISNGITHKAIATINDQVEVMIKLCDTIAFAHSQSVIHCDIKPANIMLGTWGEVTVIDWGTASSSDELSSGKKNLVGTPLYMSPEQALGLGTDERSDIYCIGATFYYLLTLQHPCKAATVERFWQLKRRGVIDPIPPERKDLIPQPLLAIMMKALAADPVNRYQTVKELADDLRRYQAGQSVGAYPDTLGEAVRRWAKRRKREIITAAAVLTLLTPMGLWVHQYRQKLKSDWQIATSIDFASTTQETFETGWEYYERPRVRGTTQTRTPFTADAQWRLEKGVLQAKSLKTQTSNLTWKESFAGSFAVEWVVIPGEKPRNLNAYIGSRNRHSGYMFHIGSFGDPRKIVMTMATTSLGPVDYHLLAKPLQSGVPTRMRMEREEHTVRLFLEDQLIIEYKDPEPRVVPEENTFGFEVHASPGSYSIARVDIFTKPLPELTHPIAVPDAFFAQGQFDLALQRYWDLYQRDPEGSRAAEAYYKTARCHDLLSQVSPGQEQTATSVNHDTNADSMYRTFISIWPDHELVPNVLFHQASRLLEQNDVEGAEEIFHSLASSYPGHHIELAAFRTFGQALLRIYDIEESELSYDQRAEDALTVIRKSQKLAQAMGIESHLNPVYKDCIETLRITGHQPELHETLLPLEGREKWRSMLVRWEAGHWKELVNEWESSHGDLKSTYVTEALFELGRFQDILSHPEAPQNWRAYALLAQGRGNDALAETEGDASLIEQIRIVLDRTDIPDWTNGTAPGNVLLSQKRYQRLMQRDLTWEMRLRTMVAMGETSELVQVYASAPETLQSNPLMRIAVLDAGLAKYIRGEKEEATQLFHLGVRAPPDFRNQKRGWTPYPNFMVQQYPEKTGGNINFKTEGRVTVKRGITELEVLVFPHFYLQPALNLIEGDRDSFDQTCRELRDSYPHHYRKRVARFATMLLGDYGEDPQTWLETLDDPHTKVFARDALDILAKGIRAERVGNPDLAKQHYEIYLQCNAVLLEGDLVSRRFARWRLNHL